MKTVLVLITILLTGCSIVPYEEEFACKRKNNLGKCISALEAYEEAVTGVEKAPYMVPASEQDDEDNKEDETKRKVNHLMVNNNKPSEYTSYLNGYYSELKELVDDPKTPMVRQARKVRTLVLPYNPSEKVIYMDRYIYSILDEPLFVMGKYLIKESVPVEQLIK
mgnify:CR=1 FL=1